MKLTVNWIFQKKPISIDKILMMAFLNIKFKLNKLKTWKFVKYLYLIVKNSYNFLFKVTKTLIFITGLIIII